MESLSAIDLSAGMDTPPLVSLLRLFVAAALGAVIGIEREVGGRQAGLKTHMLIAVAAATFTLITFEIFASARGNPGANVDPIRIIEAVTAGVAFLAAGAIIRTRDRVRGLTTGAGMWAAGAVGVSAGAGYLVLAALATFVTFIILTLIRWIEWQYLKSEHKGGGSESDDGS
ncbi:MAG: MgtC/SapB family protein [Dichotomicrobium sp.]